MDKIIWILDKIWETNPTLIQRYNDASQKKWSYDEGTKDWNNSVNLEKILKSDLMEEIAKWSELYDVAKGFVKDWAIYD